MVRPPEVVDAAEGDEVDIEAGGPDEMTQREAVELAFDVVGKQPKVIVVPIGVAQVMVKGIGLLSKQFGDLFQFIVVAGEVDGVGLCRHCLRANRRWHHARGASRSAIAAACVARRVRDHGGRRVFGLDDVSLHS